MAEMDNDVVRVAWRPTLGRTVLLLSTLSFVLRHLKKDFNLSFLGPG